MSVSVRYSNLKDVFPWLLRRVCINSNRAEATEEKAGHEHKRRAAREGRHRREEGARGESAGNAGGKAAAARGKAQDALTSQLCKFCFY